MRVAVINKSTKAIAGIFECDSVYKRSIFNRYREDCLVEFNVLILETGEEYSFPSKVFDIVKVEKI